MNPKPFVLLTTIHVKPGCEEEFLSLVHPVNDTMRHERTFVNTVLNQSSDDHTLFMLHETWLDRDDFFSVQMTRDYRQEYEARLPALLREPRVMKIFEPLRSDFVFQSGWHLSETNEGNKHEAS